MKKIFFSFLAIAALASCAKTESVYMDDNSEIKLNPVTAMNTKAVLEGTALPATQNFDVFAYWANEPANAAFTTGEEYLIAEDQTGVEFVNKGSYWGGSEIYYWPKNGSLRFAAYAPSTENMTHNLATDTYTMTFTQKALNASVDLLVAPTSRSYTAHTAADQVSVVFQHALAWVTVKAVAKDDAAVGMFTITGLQIDDVYNTADLNAAMGDGVQATEWTDHASATDYEVFSGSQPVTLTATEVETNPKGTIVIPQQPTTVTVTYTQAAGNAATDLEGMTHTIDLALDAADAPWEPGKHYVYTLIFGVDEILINPSIVDWEVVEETPYEVDAVEVATTASFAEAVQAGKNVRLTNDINLDDTRAAAAAGLVLNRDVVIDGNGHTVTTSAVRAFQIIDAKNVTIKNLNLVARGERGFQLQTDGQTLTLENVTAVSNNYTVNVTSSATNANVTVNNCDLKGLNTINVWGENANVTINNSTLRTEDNADEGYAVVYNSAPNGLVTVNGGAVVITGTKNDTYAGLVTTNNSQIVFNETEGASEVEGHSYAINYGEYRYTFATFAAALAKAVDGETIVLLKNVTTESHFNINKSVNLDMNGKTLTVDVKGGAGDDAIWVRDNAEVTISGNGNINFVNLAESTVYASGVFATGTSKVTLENINVVAGAEAVFAQANAQVVINSGTYKSVEHPEFTLNLKDSARATASILVNGGSFYQFNPADNSAEGEHTNFVAEGKTVTLENDWYTVQ